jgi:hypothetical protein
MAAAAGVKTVVLSHILRGPSTPDGLSYPVSTLIEAVRKTFSDEAIVGHGLSVL